MSIRLASAASDRKGAKIQNDILWLYQKIVFSKHQNKAEFKNLDDSEVLSSDFPGLRTSAASMASTASTASSTYVASMTFTTSFHQNKYCSWWLDTPWQPKDQYWSFFVEWIVKNPNFHWYLYPFCRRLLRSAILLLQKLVDETKISKP